MPVITVFLITEKNSEKSDVALHENLHRNTYAIIPLSPHTFLCYLIQLLSVYVCLGYRKWKIMKQ